MKEGYKKTELRDIPDSWQIVRTSEVLVEAKLGGNYKNGEWEEGLPLIKMGNIDRGKVVLNKVEYIPTELQYESEHILHENDLLLNTRNTLDLVGKVALWRGELNIALYNSNLLRMKFNPNKVANNIFMNYVFNSDYGLLQLRRFATGTTSVAAIYNKDLLKFKFPLPPLPEQQKIASILSTVDEKIEVIDAQMSQTQELKKGLMQQLLSKGIGHTKFKTSELGDIPESWEVRYVKDFSKITTGSKDTQNKIDDGLYPFIVRSQKLERINSYSFDGEAVLTAGDGVGVGKVFHYMNDKFDYHQRVYNIHSFKPEVIGRYFFEYFKHFFHFQVRKYNAKGSVDSVRMEMISKMMVAIPPVGEQKIIASIFSTVDEKLSSLNSRKAIYQELKKGLMQQLLTGKIRVKTSQNEPALA